MVRFFFTSFDVNRGQRVKSHPPRATTELFFTPSRDYRNFLAFWKLYFSSQKQSHLVKFGWKFNSDYKNNVLATGCDSFGYCNIAGK